MNVKFEWEFDVDTSDFDPKFIDIEGLAKESALRELEECFRLKEFVEDDFEIVPDKS